MRTMCLTVLAGAVLGLTGCGGGNAETAMKDMIAATNGMATALESGDLTKIQSAADNFKAVKEKHKNAKATEAETKKLMEKYGGELMGAAMKMGLAQMQAATKMTSDADKKKLEEIMASVK